MKRLWVGLDGYKSDSVTFSGTDTYTLILKDTSKGWTQTITKNTSGLDCSSAEVIMDDNSHNDKDSTSLITSSGNFRNTWIRST
jgi:hypothetical protein